MRAHPGEARALLDSVLAMPSWPTECIDWPFSHNGRGYGSIGIGGRAGRNVYVHQLACEHRHGPRPEGMEARHLCGRGASGCFNPAHLEWATPTVNQRDRVRHGTHNRGERDGQHKMTEDQVRQIRRMYVGPGGPTQRAIADQFAISQTQVGRIVLGERWSWL